MAVDPSYPLYPILCIVSAFFMFLILTHSFIRQTWNLAVTFLSIGLFLDNLTHGINAVVWRDNADIKVPVYCDIVSRLQFFMNFLPSIASFLITRKLYIISTMRDVEAPSRKAKLLDLVIEWGWGLGYPLFMTVVVYTLCQDTRFVVLQGFGCASSTSDSWFSAVVISILPVIPPLISIFLYCHTTWDTFTTYFDYGQYAVLAVAIFALFGMTSGARSAYWSRVSVVSKLFGLRQPVRQGQSLTVDSIAFAAPGHQVRLPQGTTFSVSSPSDYKSESKSESESAQATSIHRSKPEDLIV
ncbi:pheromone A receptor-domain-containing protein [Mycena rebaudengoi]|nr:pheromone A receptor-domain-containing protein [Mycena rebaudengoi]